jgi:lipopolysaccharide/colanic/teichoic acid biosynthesis glycosyltransferase
VTTPFASSGSILSVAAAVAPPVPRWKRLLDLGIGLPALILVSPVMIAAAGLIRLTSRGPILFRQTRVGYGEARFTMLKFRTMRVAPDDDRAQSEIVREELEGTASPDPETMLYRPADDPRVTAVGRVLRKCSIDELPQLLNVVRGEMSLVGPRPATPSEVELFTPQQRRRHECPPGITGLWQVSGRNRLSSREMLDLDLAYVERASLPLDIKILLRTPRAVLFDRFTR